MSWPWVPALGVELAFRVDGLSLFFALIVAGMGTLIVLYATCYLDGHYQHHGRFYAYLILFMAAMLGTVLADHVLLLFAFWELTGWRRSCSSASCTISALPGWERVRPCWSPDSPAWSCWPVCSSWVGRRAPTGFPN
jgi:NADH:ubiquinone oxidoreductase subunit 2 (subunit N)